MLTFLFLRLYMAYSEQTNTTAGKYINNNFNKEVEISPELYQLVKAENENAQKRTFEKKKSYMDLYPDMYVESVKPFILAKDKKTAYLSFDDGPSYNTSDVLKILNQYDINATFFILGCTITEEGADCLKQMAKDGHTIGIHTYSHDYKKIYSSVESFLDDFYKDYRLIYAITGVKATIFRFPWGSFNSYNKGIRDELVAEMERRGFTYYDWNLSADDSIYNPSEYQIKQNVLKNLEKYSKPIILMHDSSINRQTVRALPDLIKKIIDKGYEFDTLDHRLPYQFGSSK